MPSTNSRSTTTATTYPSVRFTALGLPGPKGSRNTRTTTDADGNSRTRSYDQSKIAAQWQKDVALQARSIVARDGLPGPLEPPYSVIINFEFARPKKPTWDWPTRGDLDKLARSTLDGLEQGGLLADDKHVTALVLTKRFGDGPPCAHITISTAI